MDHFLYHFQKEHGYADAVVFKNVMIALAFFLIGMFLMHIFAARMGSLLFIDEENEYKLKDSDISMVIVSKSKKTKRIVLRHQVTMWEAFICIVVYFLHCIGVHRGSHVTLKDIKKAIFIFGIYSTVCIVIIIFGLLLIFTVQQTINVNDYKIYNPW
jgi:hypothetical protein